MEPTGVNILNILETKLSNADLQTISEACDTASGKLREIIADAIDNAAIAEKWAICGQWLTILEFYKIELQKPGNERKKYNNELSKRIDFVFKWLQQMQSHFPETVALTLNSSLNTKQLQVLYSRLERSEYIDSMNVNDFVYMLSGNLQAATPKIKWLKSKKMLVYLLDKICINFSFPVANKCFKVNGKPLDSNDRKKVGFKEIDSLIYAPF